MPPFGVSLFLALSIFNKHCLNAASVHLPAYAVPGRVGSSHAASYLPLRHRDQSDTKTEQTSGRRQKRHLPSVPSHFECDGYKPNTGCIRRLVASHRPVRRPVATSRPSISGPPSVRPLEATVRRTQQRPYTSEQHRTRWITMGRQSTMPQRQQTSPIPPTPR